MNCAHCGAEVSDREEICTLCGKLAKVPDEPGAATDPPAAAPEQAPAPDQSAAATPAEQPKDANEGAAFCTECKKYVYLDANGCCDRGHPVSSMTDRGAQMPDKAVKPGGASGGGDLWSEGPFANNSGQGAMSSLPTELEGVNWGAFFLTWIWGIGNRVWLSFLVFVPGGSYVMPWVLLIKGNEWAWKNRRWGSVQEFQEVQRKWAIVGLALTILAVVAFCILYVLAVSAGIMVDGTQATLNNRVTPN